MTTTATPIEKEQPNESPTENQKGIENHKKAAYHHEQAAKHHHEAAKQHEEGNHEKASESTVKAHGHNSLANDAQREDVRHHVVETS